MKNELKKGTRYKINISSLAAGGDGVSRDQGLPIFVSRTAPGDLAEVQVFDVRKDFAFAQATQIIEPSPMRREAPCKLFKVCGGCQWQHINYPGQVEIKADIVRQAIKHIGGLSPELVRETIQCQNELFYRNKVQFPVGQPKGSSRILAGYYKEGSHELVNIKHCPVQPEPLDNWLAQVKDACERHNINAYDEQTHSGMLRHIIGRYSFSDNKILTTLVINSTVPLSTDTYRELKSVAADVAANVPEQAGFCINFNARKGNRILGDTTECIHGSDHINERLISELADAPELLQKGITFRLSPTSFFQVNSKQAVVLFDQVFKATKEICSAKVPLIIDAYAGVGTMAMWVSPLAEKVIAIEEMEAAVLDGKINLELNEINNVEFRTGKMEEVIDHLLKEKVKADILILDPPRKGVAQPVLDKISLLEVPRIVYVSCNPTTLARDLKILEIKGYKTKHITPIDMFPQTHHIESVTVLDKE